MRKEEELNNGTTGAMRNFDAAPENQVREHNWDYLNQETKTSTSREKSDVPVFHGSETITDISRK